MKIGDKFKPLVSGWDYKQGDIYTIEEIKGGSKGDVIAFQDDIGEKNNIYRVQVELIQEETEAVKIQSSASPPFVIMEWEDWTRQVVENIQRMLDDGDLKLSEILEFPKLNEYDIYYFCSDTNFDIYPSNVFVKHRWNTNSYWWVDGKNTCKIVNPKLKKHDS